MAKIKSKRINLLQKRARDKEYKLRRKGATQEEIAKISPRVSAQQVAAMSPQQQAAYARRLNAFNKSKTRYTALASGELVETKRISALNEKIRKYNANSRKLVAKTDALAETRGVAQYYGFIDETRLRRGGGVTKYGKRIGRLTESGRAADIQMTELPKDKETLKRREKTLTKMSSSKWDKESRAAQRKGAVKALIMMGENELANRVRNMKGADFDVLALSTDFFDDLFLTYEDYMRYSSTRDELGRFMGVDPQGAKSPVHGLTIDEVDDLVEYSDLELDATGMKEDDHQYLRHVLDFAQGRISQDDFIKAQQ